MQFSDRSGWAVFDRSANLLGSTAALSQKHSFYYWSVTAAASEHLMTSYVGIPTVVDVVLICLLMMAHEGNKLEP